MFSSRAIRLNRVSKESNQVYFDLSHHDLVFGPELGEKKFVVIKVDREKPLFKGSVRRTSSMISNSCKAILKDWKPRSMEGASDK